MIRQDIAEELGQQATLKWIEAAARPVNLEGARAWFFRVITNLAIDYRRRHSTWHENMLMDARDRAIGDDLFRAETRQLFGSPEMKAIASEHLAVCLLCTLRNMSSMQSAALLLVEVNGFSVEEAACLLAAGFSQLKNAVQSARGALRERYGSACRLVNKAGMCHQCVELDGYFNGTGIDPLAGTTGDVDARLKVLRRTVP